MKRTPLLRKTPLKASKWAHKPSKPLRRTKLAKKSKLPISKLQRKIWEYCKNITRLKYGNTCYTCSRTGLSGGNWQTGHMWAKASVGAYLKYDLRILRPQCYHCNINLGGRGADFYVRMLKEVGPEEMVKLEADRQVTVKAYDHYLKILSDYQMIATEVLKT